MLRNTPVFSRLIGASHSDAPFFSYDGCSGDPTSNDITPTPSGRRLSLMPRHRTEAQMAWRHKNRWFRRWLMVIVFWLVPVMVVAVREAQDEMAYNRVDLQRALTTWTFSDAQRNAGAPQHCRGTPDAARASGCPADVLAENAVPHQRALDEYARRRSTLAVYLWDAFVGYWVVPAAVLLGIGIVIGGIRRALRRPGANPEHEPKPVPER
jgi:hypothetical protein